MRPRTGCITSKCWPEGEGLGQLFLLINLIFTRCLEHVLEEINENRKANVMVASHNEDTIKFTLEK